MQSGERLASGELRVDSGVMSEEGHRETWLKETTFKLRNKLRVGLFSSSGDDDDLRFCDDCSKDVFVEDCDRSSKFSSASMTTSNINQV